MNYSDIGHGSDGSAMVWIFNGKGRRGGIEYHRSTNGTHEMMYGATYVDHWRGRIDLPTRVSSVKAPAGSKEVLCPDWLLKSLKETFGENTTVVNFGLGEWSLQGENNDRPA